jgi:hypothetical protein
MKNPWDIAFGTSLMSEFNIRGRFRIPQARRPRLILSR